MTELTIRRVIAARPERIFEAWTKPELLQQWWGPAWRHELTLFLMTPEDTIGEILSRLGPTPEQSIGPTLFLIFEGRRYLMTKDPFVIGRNHTANLVIRDGLISRKHATVLWRHGAYFLVDLDSQSGIEYRGLKIDNKRIEEGDVFHVATYELRFTYLGTDT